MKLGLITDLHEQIEPLEIALNRFRAENVDQIVMIGDIFELGERIEPTCRLLQDANVVGVWGNHDFGLCGEIEDAVRQNYPPVVIDVMSKLRPRLEVAGCFFTHIEPWLNPEELSDLWFFDGLPESEDRRSRIFASVPNRIMFAGHYHKWLAVTPDGTLDWNGRTTLHLTSGRYFVTIGAVCDGQFATFDTDTSELRPFQIE
jgi:predicted phosphodiesterase